MMPLRLPAAKAAHLLLRVSHRYPVMTVTISTFSRRLGLSASWGLAAPFEWPLGLVAAFLDQVSPWPDLVTLEQARHSTTKGPLCSDHARDASFPRKGRLVP